jgi:TBC1 domain family protein 5
MEENKENKVLTIPRYGKHDIEKCQLKFKTHFLDNLQNPFQLKQNVISLAINCNLREELIRPHAWKLFLKTLSFNDNITLRNWIDETYKKREDFKKKLKEANAEYAMQKQNENQSQKTKKFSNFEENTSIKHLISIDVERTYGDTKLFQDEYIRKMEEDILYVFSQENKPTSYKQGMNEILAIFIHSFYPFYITSPVTNYTSDKFDLWCSDPAKYINEIYSFFHDEKEFQSDLYYLMYNIMNSGLNKFYEDSIDPESKKDDPKTYLLLRCDYILDKLKKHNLKLYQHFVEIGLSAEVILQRWLKCVFSREYTPEDCIYIWDNILANEFNISSKNLEYIDYFCVAMFDYVSESLLTHDQNECFICLFKYPPFQTIDILVN